ncbi:hypothetical protein TNCV_5044821 [Trichonephila clavipes]|uniref:Uncharacterized protein n=1 Tax=Trichonephila clavipes TaxID=2585209 RepID=A0A8X6WHC2_TRICX|nr:hypothetical protein TNCV_5044821 [Trichonephila clavipes]
MAIVADGSDLVFWYEMHMESGSELSLSLDLNPGEGKDFCKCMEMLLNSYGQQVLSRGWWKGKRGDRLLTTAMVFFLKIGTRNRAKSYCHLYGAQSYG